MSTVAEKPAWKANRVRAPRALFLAVLARHGLARAQQLIEHLDAVEVSEWPRAETGALAGGWRHDVAELARTWPADLSEDECFAVLQQVTSVLRTSLTNDVESRLR